MTLATFREVNATIADTGTPLIGLLVGWSFQGVEILKSDVEALCLKHNISAMHCPGIEANGAVRKALDSLDTPFFIRRRKANGEDNIVFALVSEEFKDEKNPNWKAEQIITYNRATRTIELSTDYQANEIRAAFVKFCDTYRANEVRKFVQNVMDSLKAVSTPLGNFAPVNAKETVYALEKLVSDIHGGNLTILEIADVAKNQVTVSKSAHEAIMGEIEAQRKSLDELIAQIKAGERKVQSGTLPKRIAEFKAIREKARCYKDLVEMETGDILNAIADLEKAVTEVM
jgi:hypothetical protein